MSYFFKAIAIDFDGTLTDCARPSQQVLDAIREVQAEGRKVVLVTGRILSELANDFPDFDEVFDVTVAENGAILSGPFGIRRLAPPVPRALADALADRGVPVRCGELLLACDATHELAVLEEIRRLELECQMVRNRGALMVMPPGVTKATGVRAGLAELGISYHSAIAIGDAENDHSLLAQCEIGAAVANATTALKGHADLVLPETDGAGVVSLLRGPVLQGEQHIVPKRWQVRIGTSDDGSPVRIPSSQVNVLITGQSRSGKSHATGLFAEQLIRMEYSVLIMDPEGDYTNLAHLPGVIGVGGSRDLPPPERLATLIQHHFGSVVVDLSLLSKADQGAYYRVALPCVEAQRTATGLPHWIIVDEAHDPLGQHGVAREFFKPLAKGYCLITYRPEKMCREAREHLDVLIAFPREIDHVVAHFTGLSETEVVERTASAKPGQALLASKESGSEITLFTVDKRLTPHVRHLHKYVEAKVPRYLRFYFRRNESEMTGTVAANITELCGELRRCGTDVISHHAGSHDFSSWIGGSIQDRALASTIREIENGLCTSSRSDPEAIRRQIVDAIEKRYLA